MVEPENQKKNTAIDKEIVEKYRDEHDPHFLAYCHYGDNHVLRKEFLSLIDQAYISEKVLETMRDGISDMIARGVVNPCISNGNDNELVDALNIRFNEAKSIDELAAVFREARSKNIEIKEEFDNAFFMIHFLKKIIQNEDEETSKKSLNDILNFMFYVYEFLGFQWDKDIQEDKNAPLTYKSTERKIMTMRRHDAFKEYFKMFEDKWHPQVKEIPEKKKKRGLSMEDAVKTIYDEQKLKEDANFQELWLKYSEIDITKEENQEAVLKKLAYFFRKYTFDYRKEHNGSTISGFKPKGRKGHTENGKKNIGKGVSKSYKENKESQKQSP